VDTPLRHRRVEREQAEAHQAEQESLREKLSRLIEREIRSKASILGVFTCESGIGKGGGHSPKYMSYPPGADVLMDVSGGSDCTSVFRIAKIHSLR
jgi:hypothetical protein